MGLFSSAPKQKAAKEIPLEQFGFEKQDVTASQKKTIAGNQANLSGIQDLVSQTNQFQQAQALSLREQALPGFSALQSNLSSAASSLTGGNVFDLPDDLKAVLAQQAAERGVRGGTGGSQFDDFSSIRNFGEKAIDIGFRKLGLGANLLTNLVSNAPNINPLSASSFFIDPTQGAQFDISQEGQRAGFDAQFKLADQGIKQAAENSKVAAQNANAAASAGGGFLGGVIKGGISGFLTGGPAGAFAGAALGGLSAASGGGGGAAVGAQIGGQLQDRSFGSLFKFSGGGGQGPIPTFGAQSGG